MSKRNKIIAIVVFVIVVCVAMYFYFKEPSLPVEDTTVKPITNKPVTNPTTSVDNTSVVGNDEFPLVKGSRGERVKSLQRALNIIKPSLKLVVDGKLENDTYIGVITYVGTKYYPVTAANFMAIVQQSQKV